MSISGRSRAHVRRDEARNRPPRSSYAVSYLPAWLAPQSLVATRAGYLLAAVCLSFLVGLGLSDLNTPINVTVSALGVFPVLASAWFLSLRVAVAVALVGVLLQVWLTVIGSIDWLTMSADIGAMSLMVAIGRFAARNWAAMQAALDRERSLLRERDRAQQRLEAVLEVAQAILAGGPIDELMRLIAGRARSLAAAVFAAIAVPDTAEQTFTLQVVEGEAADRLRGIQVRAGAASSVGMLRTRETLIVEDLSAGFSSAVDSASSLGPAMLVPLDTKDERFGTLVLANPKGSHAFSPEDKIMLELFATQAAVAVGYARARDDAKRLAVVEDRSRISQELHDGVIQSLFAVGLQLGVMASAADAARQEELRGLIDEINNVIRDLRAYIYGLAPRLLGDRDLKPALEQLAADITSRLKVTTTTEISDEAAGMLASQANEVLQFATEALSNVVRHSEATESSLSLTMNGNAIVLEVRDPGAGFDPAEAAGKGFGLTSLRDRAKRLGGRLHIESAPGRGTSVRVVIPESEKPLPG
jgi:signal transduction histidine kinase